MENQGKQAIPFVLITGKGLHSDQEPLYEMRDFIIEKMGRKFAHLNCQVDHENEGRLHISVKNLIT